MQQLTCLDCELLPAHVEGGSSGLCNYLILLFKFGLGSLFEFPSYMNSRGYQGWLLNSLAIWDQLVFLSIDSIERPRLMVSGPSWRLGLSFACSLWPTSCYNVWVGQLARKDFGPSSYRAKSHHSNMMRLLLIVLLSCWALLILSSVDVTHMSGVCAVSSSRTFLFPFLCLTHLLTLPPHHYKSCYTS